MAATANSIHNMHNFLLIQVIKHKLTELDLVQFHCFLLFTDSATESFLPIDNVIFCWIHIVSKIRLIHK